MNRFFYSEDRFTEYFGTIYPFTTENISGYIDSFDLKNKSLLTVGSSGDQAINAILKGCNRVTISDVNPYTKYYYYLKIASIISLEMDDFLKFLRFVGYNSKFKNNKEVFNRETYSRIKTELRSLDQESFEFWDELFSKKRPVSVRRKMFSKEEYSTNLIIMSNPYLQSERLYKETRCKIQEIRPTFITQNVITDVLTGQYDNIWLSNIGVYIDLETLRKLVDKMNRLLQKQGEMLISYLYDFTKDTRYRFGWDPIYDLQATMKYLERYNPELKTFEGIERQDSILIYHK